MPRLVLLLLLPVVVLAWLRVEVEVVAGLGARQQQQLGQRAVVE